MCASRRILMGVAAFGMTVAVRALAGLRAGQTGERPAEFARFLAKNEKGEKA